MVNKEKPEEEFPEEISKSKFYPCSVKRKKYYLYGILATRGAFQPPRSIRIEDSSERMKNILSNLKETPKVRTRIRDSYAPKGIFALTPFPTERHFDFVKRPIAKRTLLGYIPFASKGAGYNMMKATVKGIIDSKANLCKKRGLMAIGIKNPSASRLLERFFEINKIPVRITEHAKGEEISFYSETGGRKVKFKTVNPLAVFAIYGDNIDKLQKALCERSEVKLKEVT